MTLQSRILIVDDEPNITFVIQTMLEKAGFEVTTLNDSSQALGLIRSEYFNLVITDLYMPEFTGMDILAYCKEHRPRLPVVMITAHATVESAVAALKEGAFDYISKPFDQTELLHIVTKAVQTHHEREKEPVPLVTSPPGAPREPASLNLSIQGSSPQIQEIHRIISKVARSPSTVLIQGESGTGKELVAYEIHRLSDRASKPFIKINCAAIPATLIESELFGYERGAFTGAVSSKPGRFELANGGTLFLDELAETPIEMQVKLLRAIQEQEFERVGGIQSIHVDVRIIAATNRNLADEVKAGRFREDLYYRLNVVPIQLPPLRERRQDVELLVQTFIAEFNEKLSKVIDSIEPRCLEALRMFAWPGNIRQLENVIERMILMAEGNSLRFEDLPSEIRGGASASSFATNSGGSASSFKDIVRERTQSVERELIIVALEETGGNVTRAAERLGLSRKGLQLKMKELDITVRNKDSAT